MTMHPLAVLLLAGTAFAGEPPRVTHIGAVAPDLLEITVAAGRVEYGCQVPYKADPADASGNDAQNRWVTRNGEFTGWLEFSGGDLFCAADRVVGDKLDTAKADDPASYSVASRDDRTFGQGVSPVSVHRKSKPDDAARTKGWEFEYPQVHTIYLRLPKPMTVGRHYTVGFTGDFLPGQSFAFDPATARSEAVHVSQIGFRPDDPVKVAFLSAWLGTGGPMEYGLPLSFRLVDAATGENAFEGQVEPWKPKEAKDEDGYARNYNRTNVYQMDFSGFSRTGTFRVVVDGVGCSFPFDVGPDAWAKAFRVSARGFYHQRSGIAMGPPYTDYTRPRTFHPDDGVKIYASRTGLVDTANGLAEEESNFGNLVKGRTNEIVPNAWGGYMDAGDWDRRIQHLSASRYFLELAELFGDRYSSFGLNIPESGNGLPDVVNEALFNLDCYRRMQTADGGIRGGIESAEHPRSCEASWQESLTILAYAPDPWSSWIYAGVAARAARVLAPLRPALAEEYRKSALRAFAWAEKSYPKRKGKKYHQFRDERNLAAAELFRLTGEPHYQDIFLQTTVFTKPGVELFVWKDHEQREAPWVYARTERPGMKADIKRLCREAVIGEADQRLAMTDKSGFRWAKHYYKPMCWGAISAPEAPSLVRAHVLTGEAKYLKGAILACLFGAGANPLNLCYTTGVGLRFPRHPLQVDSRIKCMDPPPGLTVFGPADYEFDKTASATWIKPLKAYVHPAMETWPATESYWDVFWYAPMCEYTVYMPMDANMYFWGYLAARR